MPSLSSKRLFIACGFTLTAASVLALLPAQPSAQVPANGVIYACVRVDRERGSDEGPGAIPARPVRPARRDRRDRRAPSDRRVTKAIPAHRERMERTASLERRA